MDSSPADFVALATARFLEAIPHVRALGITIDAVTDTIVHARMPVRPEFLGDHVRGIVHTGVVTSLIDSMAGLAVLVRIGAREAIATLDLRVDYLRPTVLGADLHCRAECYRLAGQIAFARATVWQHDEAQPVASSLGTFMRASSARGRI